MSRTAIIADHAAECHGTPYPMLFNPNNWVTFAFPTRQNAVAFIAHAKTYALGQPTSYTIVGGQHLLGLAPNHEPDHTDTDIPLQRARAAFREGLDNLSR